MLRQRRTNISNAKHLHGLQQEITFVETDACSMLVSTRSTVQKPRVKRRFIVTST